MKARVAPVSPRLLVARAQLRAFGKAANLEVVVSEAPHALAQPAQILHGIAHMAHLPVEGRAQTAGSNDDVAVAKVAMENRQARRLRREIPLEPAQGQHERRRRLEHGGEERLHNHQSV